MAAEKIDHSHPLFVHPSDTPGSILIPIKLTGSKNYGIWRRSMRITLQAKRKLRFVLGTCKKDSFEIELHENWETCNAIALSWIMNNVSPDLHSGIVYTSNAHLVWEDLRERFNKVNRVRIFQLHREITTITQGTDSVSTYFTKLKELWAEYDAMVPSRGCGCTKSKENIEHFQTQKLLQFLSRLNDSYDQARRQILMKTVEPTLNQAYAMIVEDETQRSNSAGSEKSNPLAMQASRGRPYKGKKPFMQCEYCNMKGHLKENYYKLVGYPVDFKGRKKYSANNVISNVNLDNKSCVKEGNNTRDGYFFTKDQYDQILTMLNKGADDSQGNKTGP
ncbi:uncharacterized protein LOC107812682 [Nicotiana tabacum]|uniref:Uncharacterized protein LOC107812682 n=1 Tax=Nicotiana tabacum TaxID=4097 RepID=A0A1S4BWP2_TOBAC|nr:PREDICTED: uncharacterized protein LOC107812682 [Nicotiana tabacum]